MTDKTKPASEQTREKPAETATAKTRAEEIGGQQGPEPTRFGDWEKAGRCSDF